MALSFSFLGMTTVLGCDGTCFAAPKVLARVTFAAERVSPVPFMASAALSVFVSSFDVGKD